MVSDNKNKDKQIGYGIIVILASCFLFALINYIWYDFTSENRNLIAKGTVIKVLNNPKKSIGSWVIIFKSNEGEKIEITYDAKDHYKDKKEGDTLNIKYNNRQPKRGTYIKSTSHKSDFRHYILSIILLVIISYCTTNFIKYLNER